MKLDKSMKHFLIMQSWHLNHFYFILSDVLFCTDRLKNFANMPPTEFKLFTPLSAYCIFALHRNNG